MASPWRYAQRYCKIEQNDYGIEVSGRSQLADTELVERLKCISIKHKKADIWKETPPKTRQVVYLDVDVENSDLPNINAANYHKLLEETLRLKLPDIVEAVIEGLEAGEKSVVWVITRESVEICASAIEKACNHRDHRKLLKLKNTRIWATHGESNVKERNLTCEEFVRHQGSGVIIATIKSLPESVSLFGAEVEHYAQMEFTAGPMVQSENRPYLKGTTKLHIIYYVAKGTYDQVLLARLRPRIETLAKVIDDGDSKAMMAILASKEEKETLAQMIARLTGGDGPEDGEADLSELDETAWVE